MNKTVSVNISGRCFHIDDTAYESLNKYLSNLKLYFKKEVRGEEVIRDVEKKYQRYSPKELLILKRL